MTKEAAIGHIATAMAKIIRGADDTDVAFEISRALVELSEKPQELTSFITKATDEMKKVKDQKNV